MVEFGDIADCLSKAAELSSGADREAMYRCAISRWYYAAYSAAVNRVGRRIGARSHLAVWQCFRGSPLENAIRQAGMDLKELREMADYQDAMPSLMSHVVLARRSSLDIRRNIGRLRPLPT